MSLFLRRLHTLLWQWPWLGKLIGNLVAATMLPAFWLARWCRRPSGSDGRKVLLMVYLDGIGDFLVGLRALHHLRQSHPVGEWRMVLVGRPGVAGLARALGWVDDVIAVDHRKVTFDPRRQFRLFREIQALSADRAVLPTLGSDTFLGDCIAASSPRVTCTTFRSGRMGGSWNGLRPLLFRNLQEVEVDGVVSIHEMHRLLAESVTGREMPQEVPRDPRGWPVERLDPEPVFALIPGANFEYRRWPVAHFTEIARQISARTGWVPMVCGGPEDRPLAEAILSGCPQAVDLTGQPLMEMAETFARCQLVFSNDTGPAHMAALMGVPVAVLHGGGNPGLFWPYPSWAQAGIQVVVQREMACYACGWKCPYTRDPRDSKPCIEGISVESALEAVLGTLGVRPVDPRDPVEAQPQGS